MTAIMFSIMMTVFFIRTISTIIKQVTSEVGCDAFAVFTLEFLFVRVTDLWFVQVTILFICSISTIISPITDT